MERRIWQAVLLRVVRDLCGQGGSTYQERLSAERWVGTYPSADFRMVCGLASIDPDRAYRTFRVLCALPPKERRRRVASLVPNLVLPGNAEKSRTVPPVTVRPQRTQSVRRFGA
jgi:hypothetical protein